ncbi:hypothetical protein Pint_13880 [Pistacia integerrima]|uniref:Uncharacterized protein n=1 Tax=Pistacia integerrima TaxID=434235 RepID=A0ACC0Y9N8_9ROSI|nr:hypothetical protein Pint_13880 [Pistacia integerrima]
MISSSPTVHSCPLGRSQLTISLRLVVSMATIGATSAGFSALEIFSANRLQMSSNVRAEELRFVVKYLFKSSFKGAQKVDVKAFLYMLDFNIMMKMIVGERWFHFEEEEMDMDMSKAKLDEFMKMFSPPMMAALGDYLPFLRWLTYFGVEKKMLKVHRKRDAFLQTLLDAYRNPNDQSTSVPIVRSTKQF